MVRDRGADDVAPCRRHRDCAFPGKASSAFAGDFIAFLVQYLDADDVLMPETLAARLDVLEQTGDDVALTAWVRWERQIDGKFVAGETVRRRLGPRPDVDLLKTEADVELLGAVGA